MVSKTEPQLDPPGTWQERWFAKIWYMRIMGAWLSVQLFVLEFFTYIKSYDYNALPKHSGETVVITGGARGIGREVMKKLLRLDYQVIMGVRSIDAGNRVVQSIRDEGVSTGSVKCFPLDLKSLASVRRFAETVLKETNRVDMLMNNAGVMFEPYGITEDGYETHFQVNHLGHFLLTKLLLPVIKKTATGKNTHCRIVNVSSLAHTGSSASDVDDVSDPKIYSPFKAYFASKLSQILFTKYLDSQLKAEGANINVYSVHPGAIVTELYVNVYYSLFKLMSRLYRSVDEGAEVIMYAAIDPEIEGSGGHYILNKRIASPSSVANDLALQIRLWDLSEECVTNK